MMIFVVISLLSLPTALIIESNQSLGSGSSLLINVFLLEQEHCLEVQHSLSGLELIERGFGKSDLARMD